MHGETVKFSNYFSSMELCISWGKSSEMSNYSIWTSL